MNRHVGIRSLAVNLPALARSNDYFRRKFPDVVASHESRALSRVFTNREPASGDALPFDREMERYIDDPFRGTVLRRVLSGSVRDLEMGAARRALEGARMKASDVDLAIVTSFLPDQPGVGNAAFLARDLGLRAPAINLESTCSSALVSLSTACAFVRSGEYRSVLVIVSCTYSRVSDESDSLSWFLGDGASAFVVSAVPQGEGVLGMGTVHTAETCDTFSYSIIDGAIRIGASAKTSRVLRETAAPYLRACCDEATRRAGLTLADIDFFVFNTPTAWFAKTCARTLEIDEGRYVDTYPLYANVGPALMPINLHHAAREGRIAKGALVLAFTIGSVGTASAAVMRWGDVALGPSVEPPTTIAGAS